MTTSPRTRGSSVGPSFDSEWASQARCLGTDPEALFVQGAAQHKAKKICSGCPVRLQCLADALDNRTEFGVWGGMTERERRALLRRNPDVKSWKSVLSDSNAAEQIA
ncbi:WhiB family redox-sensing transcriptional regulator [Antricoccus suffuscus]|uniref:Transcriptional regulator WhiB n=1 Tax=Antricoccus suffuscus TaxID=1629062 RepID=A0A2T1A444_9ACTN|nr:WhiB family transcriptional regulator [Antricoccus suffuscus]PRZ43078.1 WhiB family redox-sensing transcriptional regulator [Antricoccus suffuscus]